MKTCYLHIGHGKTATSSLQAFMHKNDDVFEAAGIWVPGDYRPFKSLNCKVIAESGRNFAGNFGPIFNAKIASNQALADTLTEYVFSRETDVLLSTELLFYYKHYIREVVKYANKRGFAVKLIAYIRRQDRTVVPAFYQNIRNHGYFKDLRAFIEETTDVRYFQYAEVMKAYAVEEPNQLVIRTFEPEFLSGHDIIQDFITALGLDIPIQAIKQPDKYANPSLPLESLEVIRGLNALGRQDLVQKVISQSMSQLQPGESARVRDYYYTADIASLVSDMFISKNDELVDAHFQGRSGSERAYWCAPADPPSGPVHLNVEKMAHALSSIVPEAA